MRFYTIDPTLENYWRGVILFGKNFATYKFALAHALYDIERTHTLISLQDLARPYSQHICAHLKQSPKQIVNARRPGPFLTACLRFNSGEITEDELLQVTVKHGFSVVLEAFHNVNGGPIEKEFFTRSQGTTKGICLTDDFYRLTQTQQFSNLIYETDARWRLVEKAWEMNLPPQLLDVHYDETQELLFTQLNNARITLTGCRESLNGYQKGHCFYCNAPISLQSGDSLLADVDHFIPLAARSAMPGMNLNGVWNLVLACQNCNRGKQGKMARVPDIYLLERLHQRNEYLINSRLPLHEAIINQTGRTEPARRAFLQQAWNNARQTLLHVWTPCSQGEIVL